MVRTPNSLKPTRRSRTVRLPYPIAYASLLVLASLAVLFLISLGDAMGRPVAIERTPPQGNPGPAAREPAPQEPVAPAVEEPTATPPTTVLAAVPTPEPVAEPVAEPTNEPTATPIAEAVAVAPPAAPVQPLVHGAPAGPSPEPAPVFSVPVPLPSQMALSGFRHVWQTFNNCGPATLAMNLSYFGSTLSQAEIGAAIRTHPEDKNVNAEELAEFARSQGFAAQARVNGDGELVRRFISHGIPVLIETWLEPEPGDGFGHYRLITGYDDVYQRWIAHDSYVSADPVIPPSQGYAGIYLPYDETDRLWAVYNRTYVLVYRHDQAPLVNEILGAQADPVAMWEATLQRAATEVAAAQAQGAETPFVWFNLGSALYHLGRVHEAAAAFDRARAIGLPWRMLWYQFEPFAAYHAAGRYEDVIYLAETTLARVQELEEVQYWYGMGLAGRGDMAGARRAWTYALQLRPHYAEPAAALAALDQ